MPRKVTKSLVRDIKPDRKYDSILVQRLINKIMLHGKKQLAERIVYEAMEDAAKKLKEKDELEVLIKALDNVKPSVETRSRRVGGATYQVPVDVRPARRLTLSLRWLIENARKRGEKSMSQRLANELMEAYSNRGNAIKKREDVHRMAEANKAFSHYNW